jgi:crotonobetainyl-CoA:carnitine CoA-transferase CaiB-like acyl-CoA transferase
MQTTHDILRALWSDVGGDAAGLAIAVLTGAEPALPSSFRVGASAQAAIAAAGIAAAEIWRLRSGEAQRVAVDMRHAAIEFRSERYLRVAGRPAPELWDRIAGLYRCGDGRWVRLHTNFPHHRDGVLRLLGCAHERDAVAQALARRDAAAFEDEAAAAGLVVAMARSFAEWDAHAQGAAVAALPPVAIERIGEAPPIAFPAPVAPRPLDGLRVLDLTRIIAGPVCGRALAAHGAETMLVTAAHLPAVEPLVIDTGRGKLSAQLDLRDEVGCEMLRALVRNADVFVEAYRPKTLAARGFAPEALATLSPGLVVVSLSAYGERGPWAMRRGFDSLVQTASGFNHAEAEACGAAAPLALPCQALDHASGYLMALGAMAALLRRAREGGSWHVRVSLAATARWLRGLGRLADGFAAPDPDLAEIADLLETSESGFGTLTAVRHAARLSRTPARWALPSVPLGTHRPQWIASRAAA